MGYNKNTDANVGGQLVVGGSASVFKIKSIFFWILSSRKNIFLIMKINNFRGDLTDISVKKGALVGDEQMVFTSVMSEVRSIQCTNALCLSAIKSMQCKQRATALVKSKNAVI